MHPSSRRAGALASRDNSLRFAAIDVGSNSVHMVIAQADPDGAVTTLWRMKEMVGLGRISFPSRRLSDEAMERAAAALARFQQTAAQRQCEKIIAIATSAVREAHNGGDFVERIKEELGLLVKVVSAREEARLIYLAVRHVVPLRDQPHLIVDVGGGSVEFIVGDQKKASLLESRKLGAARMTAEFVHSDPVSAEDLAALRRHYERELTPLCRAISALRPVKVIGTSGTLENIAAMCGGTYAADRNGQTGLIKRERFERMSRKLLESTNKQRAKMRGLDDARKDQIVAGAVLVDELFERLRSRRIHLCGSALREGILLDYLTRHVPDLAIRREVPDPRRRSVLDLARRCDWYQTHAEQAGRLCLMLFDELKPLHGMGDDERELLEYGALLHDIGFHISLHAHHKHSMYLILNGGLKGFSGEEIAIIANIARYHRKSLPKQTHEQFQQLSAPGKRIVEAGASLLRMADGLDRSHSSVIKKLRCGIQDRTVRCVLHARAEAELEIWAAVRKRDMFQSVFDREIAFELAAGP